MSSFGKRLRHHHTHGTRKLHPLAIVGICLAVAVVVTVIVGNLLNIFLDDETYRLLTDGQEPPISEEPLIQAKTIDVNAFPATLGGSTEEVAGQPSASVTLNRADGTMCYTSSVVEHFGLTAETDVRLFESISDLNLFVPYVSGVFYSQALAVEDSDLRYAVTAQESALLREFLHLGGGEILLRGWTPSAENVDAILSYVKTVKHAAGKSPVGIAIPYRVAADKNNWELLAKLGSVCDFLALDLSAEELDGSDVNDLGFSPNAERLLLDCAYLLSAYDMRLVFAESQTALISTAIVRMQPDFQVVR